MEYYTSPNDHPEFGFTAPFHWRVKEPNGVTYNEPDDVTYITIDAGYEDDIHTETLCFDGRHTLEPELAVMTRPEYMNSAGPIHGGGFPIRK